MRKVIACAAIIAVLSGCGAIAHASARSGFGVYGGIASHSDKGTFNSISPYYGETLSYSSQGVSLGLDYQVAVGDRLSIDPFLQSSAESTSGDLNPGVSASHGVVGIELRIWPGPVFLGVHAARYSEVLTDSSNSAISASGNGVGGSVGWEAENGLMIVLQSDSYKLAYSDADIDVTAVRAHVGYRWK